MQQKSRSYRTQSTRGMLVGLIWMLLSGSITLTGNVGGSEGEGERNGLDHTGGEYWS